jgi:hypothetical protein
VPLSYAETFTGEVRVNGVAELLRVEQRTKMLNPRWYEAMLAHGHSGAAEIGNRFTHLVGWGAVGSGDNWMFDEAAASSTDHAAVSRARTRRRPAMPSAGCSSQRSRRCGSRRRRSRSCRAVRGSRGPLEGVTAAACGAAAPARGARDAGGARAGGRARHRAAQLQSQRLLAQFELTLLW